MTATAKMTTKKMKTAQQQARRIAKQEQKVLLAKTQACEERIANGKLETEKLMNKIGSALKEIDNLCKELTHVVHDDNQMKQAMDATSETTGSRGCWLGRAHANN